jgi:hypothetical protein
MHDQNLENLVRLSNEAKKGTNLKIRTSINGDGELHNPWKKKTCITLFFFRLDPNKDGHTGG